MGYQHSEQILSTINALTLYSEDLREKILMMIALECEHYAQQRILERIEKQTKEMEQRLIENNGENS